MAETAVPAKCGQAIPFVEITPEIQRIACAPTKSRSECRLSLFPIVSDTWPEPDETGSTDYRDRTQHSRDHAIAIEE